MTIAKWSSLWTLIGLLGAADAFAANLTIHVDNVLPAGGTLRLGLYDQSRYPDDNSKPIASADVPAIAPETVIVLHNIPPGTYAVQTFQDVNSNNQMDTSWLGLPEEPFGFSQDAKPFLSKPGFDEVKFNLMTDGNLVIHLQTMTRNTPANKAREALRARQRK